MLLEALRQSLSRLRASLLRSSLTVLAIVIGIASVVALVSLGNATREWVNGQFSGLGANSLLLIQGTEQVEGQPLTLDDARAIDVDPNTIVAPVITATAEARHGSESAFLTVIATETPLREIERFDVAHGAFFTEFTDGYRLPVAVVGAQAAEDLDLDPETAVGTDITVDGYRFTVIGVLEPAGAVTFVEPDQAILVPLRAAQGRFVEPEDDLSYLRVAARDGDIGAVSERVEALMRTRNELDPGAENDFTIIRADSIIEAANDTTALLSRLVTAIAAISLLVGGIGIANVMLVAVMERTREIGIRRAVGAKRRDIVGQFVTEAVVLSLIGGVVGLAIGASAARAVTVRLDLEPVLSVGAIMLALGTAAAVGILAGLGPAVKAASVDPTVALQYE